MAECGFDDVPVGSSQTCAVHSTSGSERSEATLTYDWRGQHAQTPSPPSEASSGKVNMMIEGSEGGANIYLSSSYVGYVHGAIKRQNRKQDKKKRQYHPPLEAVSTDDTPSANLEDACCCYEQYNVVINAHQIPDREMTKLRCRPDPTTWPDCRATPTCTVCAEKKTETQEF